MARDSTHGASWEETSFRWQRPPRPEEPPPDVRDVSVDPFSLRQFSRLDIDRPLPIPSVSVDDRRAHASPARFDDSAPAASVAGGTMKAPAASTWLDDERRTAAHSVASEAARPRRSKLSGDCWEADLADAGFDVDLMISSSSERKATSEPQRWGSDVPLIATADADEYSFGRGKQAKHAGGRAPPFTCCMYVPGLNRRIKPPASSTAAAARSNSSGSFGKSAAVQPDDPAGTCSARRSALSVAVSLERFDCGNLSGSSSSRDLGLDLDDGEADLSSAYFDLPLELILGCDDDGEESDQPVCAAFLFDSDGVRKSVLKRRLEAGAGMEPRRPSLGKVSTDSSGRTSTHHVRVSLKSRSPAASTSP